LRRGDDRAGALGAADVADAERGGVRAHGAWDGERQDGQRGGCGFHGGPSLSKLSVGRFQPGGKGDATRFGFGMNSNWLSRTQAFTGLRASPSTAQHSSNTEQ